MNNCRIDTIRSQEKSPKGFKKMTIQRKFGWIPDIPDQRDFPITRLFGVVAPPKPNVDLRSVCPPVYNQGNLGSCTAQAIAGVIQFDQMKQKLAEQFTPSQLFIYYNERVLEGTVNVDAGAYLRDGIKTVNQSGVCPNGDWPYVISRFKKAPPQKAYDHAKAHPAVSYFRIEAEEDMKLCLSEGFPFVFGFAVYDSFMKVGNNGIVKMPNTKEKLLGGHAVMVVGYNNTEYTILGCPSNYFIVRNSWGSGWGRSGYCFMPATYLSNSNLSSDFWTIKLVE